MNERYRDYTIEQLVNSLIGNIGALPKSPEFQATTKKRSAIVAIRNLALEQLQALQEKLRQYDQVQSS